MRTKNRKRRNRQTAYWVYRKANQMIDHAFTDDVALCKAQSIEEAYKKFKGIYANVEYEDIFKLQTNRKFQNPNAPYAQVWVLTDY